MKEDPSEKPGAPFPYRKLISSESETPEVEELETPADPPMNRAQGCFAALLWLMPSAFMIALVVSGASAYLGLQLTLGVCVVFTLGVGSYSALLSRRVRTAPEGRRSVRLAERTILFFLVQILIMPISIVAMIYAYCSMPGNKF
ncbi:hypothetical protein [Luteolibacter sp. LG18]|uniref:hypothetical protein n=1 Tax=Luteolibacter sp. LG18 TaxID=2819286 RepID=UPI002B2929C5|nr:hypothetical protein llg_12320 [Luteolibacter sp. LG18]